jgi:hypothetical protein
MKRILLWALLLLFFAPACALRAQPPEGYGPPSWAPAPSWARPGAGWGGGPWGGGYPGWGAGFGGAGPWGGWFGYAPFSQVPQDKIDQLRNLAVQTQRTLVGQEAALEEAAEAYWKALDTYPVDRAAATKAWETMEGVRKQMLDTRLDSMTKAQQILGKELWRKLHEGWGPYRGGPPGGR